MTGRPDDGPVATAVEAYYTDKLRSHGSTPKGVDWRDGASQRTRLRQLSAVWRDDRDFVVGDLGYGYGAMVGFMRTARTPFRKFVGVDLSSEMIEQARRRWRHEPRARWSVASTFPQRVDFAVASGIFNVRLDFDDRTWREHVFAMIETLARSSRIGFAFNMLTVHSDREFMRRQLWYADPAEILDHCLRRWSRRVELTQDYGLYEFTVRVRHERPVRKSAASR